MILLGVDPGLRIAGFSILKKELGKTMLLECGYVYMAPTKPLQERVSIFHDEFQKKIIDWKITHLALETPFLGKNAQNFLKLGYVRGILYLLAHKHHLVLSEFSPPEVKQAVTGFGGASKDQVARALTLMFPKLPIQEKADITDAVAVSLCGLWKQRMMG